MKFAERGFKGVVFQVVLMVSVFCSCTSVNAQAYDVNGNPAADQKKVAIGILGFIALVSIPLGIFGARQHNEKLSAQLDVHIDQEEQRKVALEQMRSSVALEIKRQEEQDKMFFAMPKERQVEVIVNAMQQGRTQQHQRSQIIHKTIEGVTPFLGPTIWVPR